MASDIDGAMDCASWVLPWPMESVAVVWLNRGDGLFWEAVDEKVAKSNAAWVGTKISDPQPYWGYCLENQRMCWLAFKHRGVYICKGCSPDQISRWD